MLLFFPKMLEFREIVGKSLLISFETAIVRYFKIVMILL